MRLGLVGGVAAVATVLSAAVDDVDTSVDARATVAAAAWHLLLLKVFF
jgi:hypothetical protein